MSSRRVFLRKIIKWHTIALSVTLGVYFVLAFFDPGMLSYDLRQKFRALADDTITITATVLDPPVIPVVTAIADCNETNGTLSVALDWADDVNTYTYTIDRDSLTLVSGLATSAYTDTGVVVATTYEYVVTAYGPMGPGSATSLPVSVTTPSLCEVTAPPPAVTIVSFGGRNVDAYSGMPRVGDRRPIFTGTTSMPGATMVVTIGTSFVAQFSANGNGYWEWKPPYGVPSGSQTFTVTATDPLDSTRQATASLRFDILKRDEETGSKQSKGVSPPKPGAPTQAFASPLQFVLTVENEGDRVLQGEILHTQIIIGTLASRYDQIVVPIRYSILDENQNLLFSETRKTVLTEGAVIAEAFPIPMYMAPGAHFVQAEVLLDTLNVSRLAPFMVNEFPLIGLASGGSLTYADVIDSLGWVVFFFLLLLFLWLFLFIREFALYLQGDGEVTEYDLERAGFIRK